jgi:Ser/Thr protein kinase RdoA (MazF antagonist)
MLTEPRVDRTRLLTDLQLAYGLAIDSLEFVPVGWVAAAYVVRAGDELYFVKLWPGGRGAGDAVGRLPLVRRLHAHGFRARVPYPVPTRSGMLSAAVRAGVVALFPYLSGVTPPNWPSWPKDVLQELGQVVAELHTFAPGDTVPYRERFSVAVADEILLHFDDRAALPYRAQLLDQLDRLRSLQQSAGRLARRYVVCHTDLTGDNILVSPDGRLAVLDWDTAHLAPPEQDLALLLHGEQPVEPTAFEAVLEHYPHPVHLDLLAFFLLRRAVEDFAARLIRLHEPALSAAETTDALDGLDRWGAAQWSHLDDCLALAADAIRRRS